MSSLQTNTQGHSSPSTQGSASFFIPQAGAPAAPSLSESPVLSSPTTKKQNSTSPGNKKAALSLPSKKILMGATAIIVVLSIIGGGAALYLSQTNEDNRQQAASPGGSAQVLLAPGTGTISGSGTQQVTVSLSLSSTPVDLSQIALSVAFAGQIPQDLQFEPSKLENLTPADTAFQNTTNGRVLKVIFKPVAQSAYKATTGRITLGTLSFTKPSTGQLNLTFDIGESKVVVQQSGVDILSPPKLVTYTFQSTNTPTPTAGNAVVEQATDSANAVVQNETQGVGGKFIATATPTPKQLTQINNASANSTVPTKTPTPKLTTTLTPTPTSARQSSQPANVQKPPVSGSADVTIALLGSGILLIVSGFYLLPRKSTVNK